MNKQADSRGFTIVELLIVIVVITILAAITVVAFNGVQQRARTTTALSELTAMAKKLEMYKIDKGSYPTASENAVWKDHITQATGQITEAKNYIICRSPDGAQYALIAWKPVVSAVNPAVGEEFYYIDSKSNATQTATWNGQGSFGTISNAACMNVGFPLNNPSVWSFNL